MKYGEPGVISQVLKKADDRFFQWAVFVDLMALILLLPIKMAVIWITGVFYENTWVNIQLILSAAAFGLLLLRLGRGAVEEGGAFFVRIWNRMRAQKWLFLLLFFLLWMTVCAGFAGWTREALFGTLDRNEGLSGRFFYLCIFVCASLLENGRKKAILLNAFAVSATLLCIPGLCQAYTGLGSAVGMGAGHALIGADGWYDSVFRHFNHYGYYLTMAVLCCAGLLVADRTWKMRSFHGLLFGANVVMLLVNNTFGGILAATLSGLFMTVLLFFRSKAAGLRGAVVLVIFILLQLFFPTGNESLIKQYIKLNSDLETVLTSGEDINNVGTGRGILWKRALEFIRENPVVGCGDDGMGVYYAEMGLIQDRPANEYLQYTAYYGIPGGLLYAGALVLIFINRMKSLKKLHPLTLVAAGCVMTYAISAFFGNTMYYTTVYFFMFLGLTAEAYKVQEVKQ